MDKVIIKKSTSPGYDPDIKDWWSEQNPNKYDKRSESFGVMEDLIREFGEQYRKDIAGSFNEDGRYGDWGEAGSFEIKGAEYTWIIDEGEAMEIAAKLVKEYLEIEPGMFNQDWLSGHFHCVMSADL